MSTKHTKTRNAPRRGLGFRVFRAFVFSWVTAAGAIASAQTRAAILQAEDRRAPTANDLAILRSGSRSDEAETRRIAIRALGRLERPSLIPDIVPALRHALPE